MWRYYLIATVIVVAIGSAVFARHALNRDWTVRPDAHATGVSHASGNSNAGFVVTPPPNFKGQGGWVLSALPDCFDQTSSIEGPSQALYFHIPPARDRIPPGTTLHRGRCTVLVRDHDIWIYRDGDRLRVPPEARLYNTKNALTLVYEHEARTEVRVYTPAAPP